jgi:hypothetical protein
MSEQQQGQEQQQQLMEQFGKRITDAATTGSRTGFVIKMGRPTGNTISDPLSEEGDESVPEMVYDTTKTYYRRSMSTQDYKRYLDAKNRLAKELDEAKRIDLTLRMYEYLALKFLGMTHEEFKLADFDDIVVATLACDSLFGMGGSRQQQQQQPVPEQVKVRRQSRIPPESIRRLPPEERYYTSPDEE